jgi:hypothetical protein
VREGVELAVRSDSGLSAPPLRSGYCPADV